MQLISLKGKHVLFLRKAFKNPNAPGGVKPCPTCGAHSFMAPKDTQCEDCEKKDIRKLTGMKKGIRIVIAFRKPVAA